MSDMEGRDILGRLMVQMYGGVSEATKLANHRKAVERNDAKRESMDDEALRKERLTAFRKGQ